MTVPNETLEVEEEKKDGAANQEGEEPNADELVEGEESNSDAGGETGEVEGGGGGDGEEVAAGAGDEPVEEGPTLEERLAAVETENAALKEKYEKPPAAAPAAPVPLTDSQKAEISARWGVEWNTVDAVNNLVMNVARNLEQKMEANLGEFRKDAAIVRMSKDKEFADIESYRPGVEEFLKRFNPQFHGNKEVLTDAYYYAKGKGAKTVIKKAVNNQEKNRRVVAKSRPASPNGRGPSGGGTKSVKLTSQEESAYKAYGEPSGMTREEYAKGLARNRG